MKKNAYRLEHFRPELTDEGPEARTKQWIRATTVGFNMSEPTDSYLAHTAKELAEDEANLTAVYDDASMEPSSPIATFDTFEGTVNLAGSNPLPASLVSWVTVRSTHKRRGLLRQMMVNNLQEMASRNVPIALLTASEGGIYGRFGFQTVVWGRKVSVQRTPTFALRSPATGNVQIISIEQLQEQLPRIFEQFHSQTLGSVSRGHGFYNEFLLTEADKKTDLSIRAALHADQEGTVDGFVVYQFTGPESHQTLVVRDLIATNAGAEIGLWNFLATTDFAADITYHGFPVESVLTQALADQRAVRTTKLSDELWARVLDPVQVFENRGYVSAAKRAGLALTFTVNDPLGFATGTYRIEASVEGVRVTRVEAPADLEFTVQALAALAFGTVLPQTLADAGLIVGGSAESLETARDLFAPVMPARFHSHF